VIRPAERRPEADQAAWQEVVARRYFATCKNAIRKADPNHLILGCRFAGQAPDPVLRGLRDSVDVVSFQQLWADRASGDLSRMSIDRRPADPADRVQLQAIDSGLPNTKGAGRAVAIQQDRATGSHSTSTAYRSAFHGWISLVRARRRAQGGTLRRGATQTTPGHN